MGAPFCLKLTLHWKKKLHREAKNVFIKVPPLKGKTCVCVCVCECVCVSPIKESAAMRHTHTTAINNY